MTASNRSTGTAAKSIGLNRFTLGLVCLAFTAAFPKAGFVIAGVPIPIAFCTLTVGMVLALERRWGGRTRFSAVFLLWAAWATLILGRIAWNGATTVEIVASAGWMLLPLPIIQLAITHRQRRHLAREAIRWGFAFAGAYGIAQLFFGVEPVAVPGLTQSLGSDLSTKPLRINTATFEFYKVVSTYQNGNNIGAIAALLIVLQVRQVILGRLTKTIAIQLGLTGSALLLGGSRTAVIATVLGLSAMVIGSLDLSAVRLVVLSVLASLVLATALVLQPGLAERYSVGSLTDSNAAGRTAYWAEVLDDFSALDAAIGTTDWIGSSDKPRGGLPPRDSRAFLAEGWAGLLQQVGLVGVVLLSGLWLRLGRAHGLKWALVPIGTVLVLDSSYLFFPTLCLMAAIVAAENPWPTSHDGEDGQEDSESDSDASKADVPFEVDVPREVEVIELGDFVDVRAEPTSHVPLFEG